MGKFTGSQCIICQKPFTDDDDIVVCPVCGTPYHRACWEKQGKCINTSLHAVGGSWDVIQQETRLRQGGRVCPHCQHVNLIDAKKCESCHGSILTEEEEAQRIRISMPDGTNVYFDAEDPCCGLPPDEKMGDETLGDVANYVRTNTLYYIPLFRRFRDTGRKISLNLSCVLFPHLYFAYRKMWPMALLSALVLIVCGMPQMLVGMLQTLTDQASMQEIHNMMQQMYGSDVQITSFERITEFLQNHQTLIENLSVPMYLVSIGLRLILCLFGNYLYYRFVMKHVGKIRKNSPTDHIRKVLLDSEGGTSIWNIIGCFGIYYGASFAMMMMMMFWFM
jgi:hypothetical protein